MRALDFRKHQATASYRLSGGTLPYSLTPAQRLGLMIRQRRLKAEFLRRDQARSVSPLRVDRKETG